MKKFTAARRKRWAATAPVALLAIALVTASCGGDSDSGGTPSGAATSAEATGTVAPSTAEIESIVWGLQAPTLSMDIAKGADINSRRVNGAAFDRALIIDNAGKLAPWIVTEWANPDPLTYVFTIRTDVTFWDGTPMTSADVAFSLKRHLDPALASIAAANLGSVDTIEATAPDTVTVKLKGPDASFLYRAALDWYIIQEAYSTAAGADLGTPAKPGMGTGPYTIAKYSATDGATLERFDGYWGPKPSVKTIEFKVISDPEAARLAFLADEIQGYFDVPLLATRGFDELENVTMTYVTGSYNDMLTMNVTKPPFDDPLVRKALAQVTDREGLNGPLFNNRATVASTIVPNTQIVSNLGEDGAAAMYAELPAIPAFDIEAAKATLAQSKSPDGFEVDLIVDTTQPWMLPLAENLAANAKQIGITITPKPVGAADWVAEVSDPANAGPLQLLALGAGTPNPSEVPSLILGTGPYNLAQYTSPELEKQLADLVAAPSAEAGLPILREIMGPVNGDLPYIPLYDEQTALGLGNSLVWEGGYSNWALAQMWPLSLRAAG
jgi:peptide/nickel transport system substrate-binding protein